MFMAFPLGTPLASPRVEQGRPAPFPWLGQGKGESDQPETSPLIATKKGNVHQSSTPRGVTFGLPWQRGHKIIRNSNQRVKTKSRVAGPVRLTFNPQITECFPFPSSSPTSSSGPPSLSSGAGLQLSQEGR